MTLGTMTPKFGPRTAYITRKSLSGRPSKVRAYGPINTGSLKYRLQRSDEAVSPDEEGRPHVHRHGRLPPFGVVGRKQRDVVILGSPAAFHACCVSHDPEIASPLSSLQRLERLQWGPLFIRLNSSRISCRMMTQPTLEHRELFLVERNCNL
jgi:hypothetical protein